MKIMLDAPLSHQLEISEFLGNERQKFRSERTMGSDAQQIASFILDYGPQTLAVINGLLLLYVNAKKAISVTVTLPGESDHDGEKK